MAGTYYNPMGGQQMYNTMAPYQNRLSQYEQQYPQYGMQNQMQGYQNMPQNAPNQQSYIKGRAVTSFDEAKASMIDLDGSLYVFTDVANGKIYTKQIMNDGTAQLHTYVMNDTPPVKETTETPEIDLKEYVKRDEVDTVIKNLVTQFNSELDSIKKSLVPQEVPKNV